MTGRAHLICSGETVLQRKQDKVGMLNIHFSWLEGIFPMVQLFRLAVVCHCHLNKKDLKEPRRIMPVSHEISMNNPQSTQWATAKITS